MFEERVVLGEGVQLELRLRSPADFRLACWKDGRVRVEFGPVQAAAYPSVERLRYEFERKVEDALREG
jgi:hypothetical protein